MVECLPYFSLLFLTLDFTEGEHCCWVHNKISARNHTHVRTDPSSRYISTNCSQRRGFFPRHKVCYTIYMVCMPNNHRLFSKFTVSTTSHQHVRIASAQLEGPSGLHSVKVAACVSSNRGIVVSRLLFEAFRSTDCPKDHHSRPTRKLSFRHWFWRRSRSVNF